MGYLSRGMTRRDAEAQVAGELAGRGLRATRQRIGVLRLLRSSRCHPTVAQVHESLLQEQPRLSLKTVYDTLESLVACGLATCVADGPGPARYEAPRDPHYHARCRACGRLFDLEARSDRQIRARTAIPKGFAVENIAVTIVGLCSRCRSGR
jgi:Fur family peroxide stress response transcriptional regulator